MKIVRLGEAVSQEYYEEGYWRKGSSTEAKLNMQEALAEDLNNSMQNMWRSTRQAQLPLDNPVVQRIDAAQAKWEPWWAAFKNSTEERARDEMFDWLDDIDLFTIGADWDSQLKVWEDRVLRLDTALRQMLAAQVLAGQVDPAQAKEYSQAMEQRGETEKLQRYAEDAGVGMDPRAKGLLLGFAAMAGLGGLYWWLTAKKRKR